MIRHNRDQLLELLHQANASVANGQLHLNLQQARMARQESEGRRNPESAKLLRNMLEAQSLMISHVRLLQSEIKAIKADNESEAGS